MILQYAYLLVFDMTGNPFINVTLNNIGNFLPLLGGLLTGDCDKHP